MSMLEYSLTAFHKIKNDFLRIKRVFDVITPLFSIAFLTYAVIAKTGVFWANVILLSLAVAYYVFHVIVTFRKTDKELKRTVKTIYKACVRIIKLFTLGVALYGLWFSMGDANPLSMLLTILSLVGWLLQVALDIILYVINRYANFLKEAIMADIEELKKPVTNVTNFFKKMTGKEIEEKEISKTRAKLDEMVVEHKEERKALKAEAKEQKRQGKLAAKLFKRQKGKAETEIAVADAPKKMDEKNTDDETRPAKKGLFARFKKK